MAQVIGGRPALPDHGEGRRQEPRPQAPSQRIRARARLRPRSCRDGDSWTLIAWNSRPDPNLLDQAEQEAETAIRLDPDLASPYVALTFVYSMRGLFDTAEEMSSRSLERAPEDPWVLQRFDEAEVAFRRAIELRPDFPAGYLGIGLVLDLMGRHREAIESFEACLELDPDSIQCLLFGGLAFDNLGRHGEALDSLEKVSRQNPGHPLSRPALLYEAVELGRLGRVDEQAVALETAERVFKASPKMWFNLKGLAGVAAQRGDLEAALAWLRQAVDAGLKSANQIRKDPALQPLHDDPEFVEILDRIQPG